MRRTVTFLAIALFACTTAQRQATPDSSARLFIGGVVVAGPQQTPVPGYGVLTRAGRIVEVGPAAALRSAHPLAVVVDASSATILPGLTDAHAHLHGLGVALDAVNLAGTTSYEEVIARVKARAATTPKSHWITGRGWDQNDWPGAVKNFPSAEALDAAVPDHPVWVRRIDGHAALANSMAMRLAGITAATPEREGGRILRDPAGKPTGVFIDNAMDLIDAKIPAATPEQRKARVLAAAREIAAKGLTEIHDAGIDGATIMAVRELIDEGRFPIRVYAMLSDNDELLDSWLARRPLVGYGERLTVRSIKLYADGALGSRGAALLEPYTDDPGNRGLMVSSAEHIEEVARRARAAGYQVGTHAIGDRGVRAVIDAYSRAGVSGEDRFRIEHLQVIAPEDVAPLVRRGIIASMQPTHATSDMYWAEARLGPERVKGAYAWRTVLDAGGRLALGSDFPVEEVSPLLGIYAAVTRQDVKGWPAGGWYPSRRLTLSEAIRGFTSDAAWAAFEENSRGTIEPGKLADFTIIEGNLFEMNPADLHRAKVLYTVVGGEVVSESR